MEGVISLQSETEHSRGIYFHVDPTIYHVHVCCKITILTPSIEHPSVIQETRTPPMATPLVFRLRCWNNPSSQTVCVYFYQRRRLRYTVVKKCTTSTLWDIYHVQVSLHVYTTFKIECTCMYSEN